MLNAYLLTWPVGILRKCNSGKVNHGYKSINMAELKCYVSLHMQFCITYYMLLHMIVMCIGQTNMNKINHIKCHADRKTGKENPEIYPRVSSS